jgi:hypothetical protein
MSARIRPRGEGGTRGELQQFSRLAPEHCGELCDDFQPRITDALLQLAQIGAVYSCSVGQMSKLTFLLPSCPCRPVSAVAAEIAAEHAASAGARATANSQCPAALCRAAQQTGRSQRRRRPESLGATRVQGQDYPATAAFIPEFRRCAKAKLPAGPILLSRDRLHARRRQL